MITNNGWWNTMYHQQYRMGSSEKIGKGGLYLCLFVEEMQFWTMGLDGSVKKQESAGFATLFFTFWGWFQLDFSENTNCNTRNWQLCGFLLGQKLNPWKHARQNRRPACYRSRVHQAGAGNPEWMVCGNWLQSHRIWGTRFSDRPTYTLFQLNTGNVSLRFACWNNGVCVWVFSFTCIELYLLYLLLLLKEYTRTHQHAPGHV